MLVVGLVLRVPYYTDTGRAKALNVRYLNMDGISESNLGTGKIVDVQIWNSLEIGEDDSDNAADGGMLQGCIGHGRCRAAYL